MSNFIESRPQRLCLMCAKCCRISTTYIDYKDLLELVDNGDEGARDFLDIFEPYPSIDAARKVHPDVVDNILANSNKTAEEITFYRCKYILDNNLCGRYENRPELCMRFPATPWAVVPPGCGYEGWLFKSREELKQNIRRQKEILLEFESALKNGQTPEMAVKLEEAIKKINDIIKAYAKYGAEDW